jgi:hypothetical protein
LPDACEAFFATAERSRLSDRCDTDPAAWAESQADALRRRAANEIDWNNVAEEIEGVAANQKREVRLRLRVICEHLLKWRLRSRRRPQGWRNTLDEQRRQLQELFEDSPSLRGFAERALPAAYVNGRQDVERKIAALGLPDDVCPWSLEQVLSIDFLPD